MTREEFKVLVKAMKAVYTHPSFIPDQHAFDVWYEMLKDLDYKTASYAVKKYMISEEREPNVASIRKHAIGLIPDPNEQLNEMAAWEMVQRAIRNSTYHAEEEFDKLPEIIQKAVVHPRQLREWATMENIDGRAWNVMQSNFMRTYRSELEREKENRKLSPDLLNMVKMREITKKDKELIGNEQSRAEKDEKGEREKIFSPPYEHGIELHSCSDIKGNRN